MCIFDYEVHFQIQIEFLTGFLLKTVSKFIFKKCGILLCFHLEIIWWVTFYRTQNFDEDGEDEGGEDVDVLRRSGLNIHPMFD